MKGPYTAFFTMIMGIFLLLMSSCMIRNVVEPGDIAKEENRLSEQINSQNDPGPLSDLYLRRAKLRLRYDNPSVDYHGALADLRKAVDLQPNREDLGDLKDLIAILERLESLQQETDTLKTRQVQSEQELRKSEQEVRKAGQEIQTLQNDIEQLEKQRQALRKKIDELQSLELEMEQLRHSIR